MKKEIDVYLEDILKGIQKIEKYTKDIDFDSFTLDDKTQDAVIRNFEIIGEASNRLPDSFFEKYSDFPAREATSMRNFLIHDYDSIDAEVIWKTLKQDIPELKKIVLEIVENK